MFFFYQEEPKAVWVPALASERGNILRTKDPALCTVLDVDSTFEDDQSKTTPKYLGPLYWDIDSEDLETAIQQGKKLLEVLKGHEVDLNTLRCYLTGGRGMHILMDMGTFMTKVPPTGILSLPAIYKEMVWSKAFVDDVDLRVYSCGRGRQWRCSNHKRENGAYKVSVTANELMAMTVEQYTLLCAAPRAEAPVEPAKFNAAFGLAFSVARDKVTSAVQRRKMAKKTAGTLTGFKGQWPATLLSVMAGEGVKEDAGFNQIAMQVALTGLGLGKTDEEILEASQGLIENHRGDSSRYGTPARRRSALKETIHYFRDNPCYEYSAGGVMSLLTDEAKAASDLSRGEYTKPTGEDSFTDPEENPPIKLDSSGIWTKGEFGYTKVCSIGIGKAMRLLNDEGQTIGYDVDVYRDGEPLGSHCLTMDKLVSRSAFQQWSFQWSSSMSASDIQSAKIADILSKRTTDESNITRIVTREGVDLIVPAGSRSEDDFETIWASVDGVIGSKGGSYKFRPKADKSGTYRSDLMSAPDLTLDDERLVHCLLHMNSTENVAKLAGWFSAAFLTPFLRRFYRQFPSLQVFGHAGAGKSKSVQTFNQLHYYMQLPRELQATGGTAYVQLAAVGGSSSMPVVFEEVKQREMTKQLKDQLLNMFRGNYDGQALARGGLSRDAASKEVVVNRYANEGPIVFVGESLESQAAIIERCIVVSMTKADRSGKSEMYAYLRNRATEIGKIGRAMANNALAIDMREMRNKMDDLQDRIASSIGVEQAENLSRPVYNLSVVALGLDLLRCTLAEVFGDRFDGRMAELSDFIIEHSMRTIPVNMSEAARVLEVMSQLSYSQEVQYQLSRGLHYTLSEDGGTMDLKLVPSYAVYVKWVRSLGQDPLFDNERAWIAGMSGYAGTVKKACPENSQLHDSPKAVVYRINLVYTDKEEVNRFKGWDEIGR
jgi:hypothetical protein